MSAPQPKVIRINRKNVDLSSIEVPEKAEPNQSEEETHPDDNIADDDPEELEQDEPMEMPEDPLRKAELIDIILDYHSCALGRHLKHYSKDPLNLQNLTIEQLESQLLQMESALASRNNQQNFQAATTSGLIAIERMSLAAGMQVQGWSSFMAGNENLQDVVQEIRIKRFRNQFQAPEARLIAIIGGSLIATHTFNQKRIAAMAAQPSTEQPSESKDKYAGL